MISLAEALTRICAEAPASSISALCSSLRESKAHVLELIPSLSGVISKESIHLLQQALSAHPTSADAVALALETAFLGIQHGVSNPRVRLVWTGPETGKAHPRAMLPQILEMIGRASDSLLIVTFAAFGAAPIMAGILGAHKRGVRITVVLETVDDSAGQLSKDGWRALPQALLDAGCVWIWPLKQRDSNRRGLPGKLHAKCLAVDDQELLVTSANLTDDAMERNIEVGLHFAGSASAKELRLHFEALRAKGILVPALFPAR